MRIRGRPKPAASEAPVRKSATSLIDLLGMAMDMTRDGEQATSPSIDRKRREAALPSRRALAAQHSHCASVRTGIGHPWGRRSRRSRTSQTGCAEAGQTGSTPLRHTAHSTSSARAREQPIGRGQSPVTEGWHSAGWQRGCRGRGEHTDAEGPPVVIQSACQDTQRHADGQHSRERHQPAWYTLHDTCELM
jgi:hypothetical protein